MNNVMANAIWASLRPARNMSERGSVTRSGFANQDAFGKIYRLRVF
jgi:hypothetical protein